jgi:hypothetical protein
MGLKPIANHNLHLFHSAELQTPRYPHFDFGSGLTLFKTLVLNFLQPFQIKALG